MTDDLDDLKAAMRAATPDPDPHKRAADLARAQKNFAALQESRDGMRQTSDRPKTGLIRGLKNMLGSLSNRGRLDSESLGKGLVSLQLFFRCPIRSCSLRKVAWKHR